MSTKLHDRITAVLLGALSSGLASLSALASDGGRPRVPEIDGPGAMAAIALLATAGAIFYNKSRK